MPSSFNNKQSFWQKLKNKNVSRSYILTFIALTLSLVVIIAAAVAANRTKKPIDISKETDKPTTKTTERNTDAETNPKPTEKATNNTSNAASKIPSFILPVSGNLTHKHDPTLQVFSNTMQDYRVHLGIDIATKESAPVYAAADGKISKIWVDTLMGYCIAIKHSGDCVTIYKNLAEILPEGIAEGVSVRSGQLIATVGESAMVEVADDPHLHFEMTVGNLAVDPLEYFNDNAIESIKKDKTTE